MQYSVCDSTPPRGFTLVEFVAGMVLLATLLVGVLQAYGLHHRQLTHAENRLAATHIADAQLSAWLRRSAGVPTFGGGPIVGKPGWSWQTRRIGQRFIAGLAVDIIRHEVYSLHQGTGSRLPLSSVDIVQATHDSAVSRRR